MIHAEASPLAGTTVRIREGVKDPVQGAVVGGAEYRVEDWWDRVGSQPWGMAQDNPACLHYAMRIISQDPAIPVDGDVLYGKIGYFGHLVHISEVDGAGDEV